MLTFNNVSLPVQSTERAIAVTTASMAALVSGLSLWLKYNLLNFKMDQVDTLLYKILFPAWFAILHQSCSHMITLKQHKISWRFTK